MKEKKNYLSKKKGRIYSWFNFISKKFWFNFLFILDLASQIIFYKNNSNKMFQMGIIKQNRKYKKKKLKRKIENAL